MPRKARVEYAGAIYHVMDRGDHLEAIYRGGGDRLLFLKTLEMRAAGRVSRYCSEAEVRPEVQWLMRQIKMSKGKD